MRSRSAAHAAVVLGRDGLERLEDGGAVLLVAHADADRRVGRCIDDEFEVEVKPTAIEHDRDLLAIADPLRAAEEGREGAAQRVLVA